MSGPIATATDPVGLIVGFIASSLVQKPTFKRVARVTEQM